MRGTVAKQASALVHPRQELPRIAFVGPIAEPGKPASGGYEAANRRTVDLLRQHGVNVLELPYSIARGSVVRKSATYALGFAEIAARLTWQRADWDILHITPHLRQFLTAEACLCHIAQTLRRQVFLDIRAGALMADYEKRGRRYRRALEQFLTRANLLAIEGLAYAPFVRQWYDKELFYFPNYVIHREEPAHVHRPAPNQAGTIRLVTVGRLVPAKGVELAIDLTEHLRRSGSPVHLEVIGRGDPAYIERLKTRSQLLPVSFTGSLPPHEIASRLAKRHFFIFATTHSGEGHSNALTEAMALGVVPVCSDNGFNRDVVGNAGIVLPKTANVEMYADAVRSICSNDRSWLNASLNASNRVQSNFTDHIVLPQLIDTYKRLFRNDGAVPRRPLRSAA
jgi:glycosyltransferase involved in cell wall biosynthesis